MKVEFDLRRDLAQMHLDLLLQMRIAAQERRQELARRRRHRPRPTPRLKRQRHERAGRAFREPVEAMLHANEFQFGPGMVRLGREEKARRFPAARADPAAVTTSKSRSSREPLRAAVPRLPRPGWSCGTIRALSGLNSTGAPSSQWQRPLVPHWVSQVRRLRLSWRKGLADAVLVGQQERQKIAEPAEQHLVFGGEKFRAVGRLVAKAAHLEEIARAFLELRRIDAQIDLDARLQRIETATRFSRRCAVRGADAAGASSCPSASHSSSSLAEGIGLLRALLLLEIGAVEVGLERGGNLAVVAAMNFPGQPPGEFLGVGLAADRRADGGIEKIGQIDLRLLEQVAELGEAVPLAARLEKAGQGRAFGPGRAANRGRRNVAAWTIGQYAAFAGMSNHQVASRAQVFLATSSPYLLRWHA